MQQLSTTRSASPTTVVVDCLAATASPGTPPSPPPPYGSRLRDQSGALAVDRWDGRQQDKRAEAARPRDSLQLAVTQKAAAWTSWDEVATFQRAQRDAAAQERDKVCAFVVSLHEDAWTSSDNYLELSYHLREANQRFPGRSAAVELSPYIWFTAHGFAVDIKLYKDKKLTVPRNILKNEDQLLYLAKNSATKDVGWLRAKLLAILKEQPLPLQNRGIYDNAQSISLLSRWMPGIFARDVETPDIPALPDSSVKAWLDLSAKTSRQAHQNSTERAGVPATTNV